MAYIAATPRTYIGESVGIGQCVAFTQRATGMPVTRNWRRGVLVKGNMSIVPGTAIATLMIISDMAIIPMVALIRQFISARMPMAFMCWISG